MPRTFTSFNIFTLYSSPSTMVEVYFDIGHQKIVESTCHVKRFMNWNNIDDSFIKRLLPVFKDESGNFYSRTYPHILIKKNSSSFKGLYLTHFYTIKFDKKTKSPIISLLHSTGTSDTAIIPTLKCLFVAKREKWIKIQINFSLLKVMLA
ncbi:hypothetical protein ACTFIR_007484 [Dictyostelium discoideum]